MVFCKWAARGDAREVALEEEEGLPFSLSVGVFQMPGEHRHGV